MESLEPGMEITSTAHFPQEQILRDQSFCTLCQTQAEHVYKIDLSPVQKGHWYWLIQIYTISQTFHKVVETWLFHTSWEYAVPRVFKAHYSQGAHVYGGSKSDGRSVTIQRTNQSVEPSWVMQTTEQNPTFPLWCVWVSRCVDLW